MVLAACKQQPYAWCGCFQCGAALIGVVFRLIDSFCVSGLTGCRILQEKLADPLKLTATRINFSKGLLPEMFLSARFIESGIEPRTFLLQADTNEVPCRKCHRCLFLTFVDNVHWNVLAE
jgi:hypothetical protein